MKLADSGLSFAWPNNSMTVYFHILFLQELKVYPILYFSNLHNTVWSALGSCTITQLMDCFTGRNLDKSFLSLAGNHAHCYLLIVYLNVSAIWLCGFIRILENTWFSRYLHVCKTYGIVGMYM